MEVNEWVEGRAARAQKENYRSGLIWVWRHCQAVSRHQLGNVKVFRRRPRGRAQAEAWPLWP